MSGAQGRPIAASAPLRYSRVSIVLHWLIAGCVLALISLGLFGASVETALGKSAIAVHKILGLTILGLNLLWAFWRLTHPAPALPEAMSAMLRIIARAVQTAFYILLVVMPLSGWWMTSAYPKRHPIDAVFFDIPFLPVPVNMASSGGAHEVHEIGAWVLIALAILHTGAALKHQFIDRDKLLSRMSIRRSD